MMLSVNPNDVISKRANMFMFSVIVVCTSLIVSCSKIFCLYQIFGQQIIMWQLLLQTRTFNINFGVEMKCDALLDFVRFLQIKSRKKHPARSVFYGFKLYNWYQDMQSITNIKEFWKTGLSHHTQEMYEVVIKEVLFFSLKNKF